MTYTLDAFIKDAKSALADNEGPAGREKVRLAAAFHALDLARRYFDTRKR